jgi:hypothetical protein
MEVSGQLHTPAALPLGKVSQMEIGRRWDEVQNRDGHDGEEKRSLTPAGNRIFGHPIRSLSLYSLRFVGS